MSRRVRHHRGRWRRRFGPAAPYNLTPSPGEKTNFEASNFLNLFRRRRRIIPPSILPPPPSPQLRSSGKFPALSPQQVSLRDLMPVRLQAASPSLSEIGWHEDWLRHKEGWGLLKEDLWCVLQHPVPSFFQPQHSSIGTVDTALIIWLNFPPLRRFSASSDWLKNRIIRISALFTRCCVLSHRGPPARPKPGSRRRHECVSGKGGRGWSRPSTTDMLKSWHWSPIVIGWKNMQGSIFLWNSHREFVRGLFS